MHRFFLCFRGFLLSGMFSGINVEAHAAHGRMAITIRMFERRSPETKETYAQGLAAFYVCQLPSMLYLRYSICCLCSRLHLNVCDLCVLFLKILSRIHFFFFRPPVHTYFYLSQVPHPSSISSAASKLYLTCRIQDASQVPHPSSISSAASKFHLHDIGVSLSSPPSQSPSPFVARSLNWSLKRDTLLEMATCLHSDRDDLK